MFVTFLMAEIVPALLSEQFALASAFIDLEIMASKAEIDERKRVFCLSALSERKKTTTCVPGIKEFDTKSFRI